MNVLMKSVKDAKGRAPSESKMSIADVDAAITTNVISTAKKSSGLNMITMGYLGKKSGGKRDATKAKFKQNWHKRFFVMTPGSTVLSYFKSEAAQAAGKEELGSIEVKGSTLFLKEVQQGGLYRFTVATSSRELKLRAFSEADYTLWLEALKPLAATFRELTAEDGLDGGLAELNMEDEDDDDDDDDDDGLHADGRERAATKAGGVRGRSATKDAKSSGSSSGVTMASGGTFEGWLEKKPGLKEGKSSMKLGLEKHLGKWEKRYFVLPDASNELSYYHAANDYLAQRPPLGSVRCDTVFVKEVSSKDASKGKYRFTVRDEKRELKLRAESDADCTAWVAALTRGGRARLLSVDDDDGGADDDDEDHAGESGSGGGMRAAASSSRGASSSVAFAPVPLDVSDPADLGAAPAAPVPKKKAGASNNPFEGEDDDDDEPASYSANYSETKPSAAAAQASEKVSAPVRKKSAMAILSGASGKH